MENKNLNENEIFPKFNQYFDKILKAWTSFRMALDSCPECLNQYIDITDNDGNLENELEILMIIKQVKFDIFTILVNFFITKEK